MILVGFLLAACSSSTDCMWPGRPDCEPVGTTLIVEDTLPDDPLCGTIRYFDEVGEAAFEERWCQ